MVNIISEKTVGDQVNNVRSDKINVIDDDDNDLASVVGLLEEVEDDRGNVVIHSEVGLEVSNVNLVRVDGDKEDTIAKERGWSRREVGDWV